jgi:queuine/archaeosine tRNA-ribosyltransferase
MSKSLSGVSIEKLFQGRIHGRSMMSATDGTAGSSNDTGIYMDTNSGRHIITVDEYISRVQLEKPAIVIAMADEVAYSCGKRKLLTAVKRTQAWFEKFRNIDGINWESSMLVGAVVGGKCADQQLGPDCVIAQTQFLLTNGAQGMYIFSSESQMRAIQLVAWSFVCV